MYSSIGHVESGDLTSRTFRLFRRFLSDTFNIPIKKIPRILFHGIILACIIAGFWLLDSLKDPVLANIVGIEYQPIAKFLSVVFILFIVCVYDYLTSIVSKPALFHIVANLFGLTFMIFAALLSSNTIGLGNQTKSPHRWLGWICYFTIEAYGSLSVAMFWSFTNSLMDLEQAKGAYGLIIAIAQFGAVFGSTLATNAVTIGIPRLFVFGSLLVFPVSILIKVYHLTYPLEVATVQWESRVRSDSESSTLTPLLPLDEEIDDLDDLDKSNEEDSFLTYEQFKKREKNRNNASSSSAKPKTFFSSPQHSSLTKQGTWESYIYRIFQNITQIFRGFVEGLSLIIKYPYVMKLLGVSCLYEIVVVILDYEFKLLGSHVSLMQVQKLIIDSSVESLAHNHDLASNQFANLLGHFGQLTNIIAFLLSLFGFSFLVHRIGVKNSLMIFPITLLICVVISYLFPTMWTLFVSVSMIKAMLFSLHDPVKELLYIPTSESIKYKAKAWIDVFGSRFAKACGSFITSLSYGNPHTLRNIGEIPALLCAIVVIALTWSIGDDFLDLVRTNTVVGDILGKIKYDVDTEGPLIDGLRPGDVGYTGYDPELFEGVFEDEEENDDIEDLNKFDKFHAPYRNQGRAGIIQLQTQQQQQQQLSNVTEFDPFQLHYPNGSTSPFGSSIYNPSGINIAMYHRPYPSHLFHFPSRQLTQTDIQLQKALGKPVDEIIKQHHSSPPPPTTSTTTSAFLPSSHSSTCDFSNIPLSPDFYDFKNLSTSSDSSNLVEKDSSQTVVKSEEGDGFWYYNI
jgi:ATP/ADP translocase